ncbi:protein NETWORKED 2A-like [Pistacia vera]|uniref:protein NETWORKED 2A-like n=1 Tax=Pistacia vera TaxID=55513 RepID=UPI001263CB8B|nr:protein NETWORKED 2A-like [Pistacia vera]
MLQRAASNAYSWWWASHIRTKQSKWLEENLQDIEDKVGEMLKIIDDDGDSFAQRAEMYYRKRPELINHVEYSYRSYRALAERYDHLSKELQSANRTIATVYPEQVQFEMDAEDEDVRSETSSSDNEKPSKGFIPKVPAAPMKDFLKSPSMGLPKKWLRKAGSSAKAPAPPPKSGLTKNEALEEIDKLQKEILGLQTEKEFVKSSHECAYEKYWGIESRITEIQANVSCLQDEFGIGTVIDDNEARNLMASTALNSCQETLAKLQEKQEQSAGLAKVEFQRILQYHEKIANLRNQALPEQTNEHKPFTAKKHVSLTAGSSSELKDLDPEISSTENSGNGELLGEKFKEQLAVDSNSSLSVTQLAEKIDGVVDKVVNLEYQVSSQTALVTRLRSENDQIQAQIQSLEGDKEALIAGSDNMNERLIAVEEELARIRSLNQSVEDQNNNLQTHFTEASCNIDYLSEKLQSVDFEEDVEDEGLFPQVKAASDAKEENEFKEEEEEEEEENAMSIKDPEPEKDNNTSVLSNSVEAEQENIVDSCPNVKLEINSEHSQKLRLTNEENDEKKDMSYTRSCNLNIDLEELGIEEGDPNWRMLSPGLEEREKILIEEYTSVLQNYMDVKRKLSEVEKKNRDGFIELALQIRELENAVAFRDDEIQSLRNKISSPQSSVTESHQGGSTSRESITQVGISPESNFSSQASPKPVPFSEHSYDFKEKSEPNKSPQKEETNLKVKYVKTPSSLTTIEEKIRSDIDELLEENLEFWLRFSTSYHQIQRYQSTVRDLKAELTKLKINEKKEENTKQPYLPSDPRAIYKHLREIQTELTLWLENNEVLKDELHGRYSCLCNIQEEIARVSSAGGKAEENGLSNYQAAKFLGEVLNMKQENTKIADQLCAGHERVEKLKMELETTLAKLDEEFRRRGPTRSPSRARIPLQSFLFGVKLKKHRQKPSLFSCMNPALQKQYSSLAIAGHYR